MSAENEEEDVDGVSQMIIGDSWLRPQSTDDFLNQWSKFKLSHAFISNMRPMQWNSTHNKYGDGEEIVPPLLATDLRCYKSHLQDNDATNLMTYYPKLSEFANSQMVQSWPNKLFWSGDLLLKAIAPIPAIFSCNLLDESVEKTINMIKYTFQCMTVLIPDDDPIFAIQDQIENAGMFCRYKLNCVQLVCKIHSLALLYIELDVTNGQSIYKDVKNAGIYAPYGHGLLSIASYYITFNEENDTGLQLQQREHPLTFDERMLQPGTMKFGRMPNNGGIMREISSWTTENAYRYNQIHEVPAMNPQNQHAINVSSVARLYLKYTHFTGNILETKHEIKIYINLCGFVLMVCHHCFS